MQKKIALALAASIASFASVTAANAEVAFGITGASAGGSLIQFDTATPTTAAVVGSLQGIASGFSLRAIDFRPANGQLYGLATNATNGFQLYTINTATAAVTPVGAGGTITSFGTNGTTSNFPLRTSIDFNPTVDRLRVVTGNGQNFRINPNTGALVLEDANLDYVATDPAFSATNKPLIADVAYTNNVVGATSTTLYAWDYVTDNLVTIGSVGGTPVSPNAGTMFTVGGPANFITADAGLGLDISSATGIAYMSYFGNIDGGTGDAERLASVNLSTGAVTQLGVFGSSLDVLDISVVVPEPSALGLLAAPAAALLRRRRA